MASIFSWAAALAEEVGDVGVGGQQAMLPGDDPGGAGAEVGAADEERPPGARRARVWAKSVLDFLCLSRRPAAPGPWRPFPPERRNAWQTPELVESTSMSLAAWKRLCVSMSSRLCVSVVQIRLNHRDTEAQRRPIGPCATPLTYIIVWHSPRTVMIARRPLSTVCKLTAAEGRIRRIETVMTIMRTFKGNRDKWQSRHFQIHRLV